MEEKYIKFYQSFHKGFQGKKSNSLFCYNQSPRSRLYSELKGKNYGSTGNNGIYFWFGST